MELHQLRYLVAVVDHGSFTAAADSLHVSQSGVSAQLAKLERELGAPLLERGPRQVRLTTAGTELLPLAREALRSIETIAGRADELANVVRGRVRLGMIVGCSIPPFLDAIAAFHRARPGVEISLAEDTSYLLQTRVLAGELDVALISYAEDAVDGLRVSRISDERLAVISQPGHPIAGRPVRLRDLAGHTVLCLPQGTGIRTALDRSCARRGITVDVDIDATSPETLLGLTARGLGVSVLTTSMAARDGLTATPIQDADVTASLALVTRNGTIPPATRLLHAELTRRLVPESGAIRIS
jgi:DNA-binding transcriptional LysR family regulator